MEYLILGSGEVTPNCPGDPGRCAEPYCWDCPNFCNGEGSCPGGYVCTCVSGGLSCEPAFNPCDPAILV